MVLDSTTQSTSLPAGYYGQVDISTTLNPTGNVEYIHHIHSLTTTDDTETNSSASTTSVSGGLADSYEATTSGGCYTTKKTTTTRVQTGTTSQNSLRFENGHWVCNVCGRGIGDAGDSQTPTESCYHIVPVYTTVTTTTYTCSCGMTNGQVIRAIITY